MNKDEIKAKRDEAIKNWQDTITESDNLLKETHSKKEYTFTQEEARHFLKLANIQAQGQKMAEVAALAVNEMLNDYVLPRIGIIPENQQVVYEPVLGRFCVWTKKADAAEPVAETPVEIIEQTPIVEEVIEEESLTADPDESLDQTP